MLEDRVMFPGLLYEGCCTVLGICTVSGLCTALGLLTCVMRLEMYPVLEDSVMCSCLFPQFSTDSGSATVTNNRRDG